MKKFVNLKARKKYFRILALLFILMIISAVLAGCRQESGSSPGSNSEAGTLQESTVYKTLEDYDLEHKRIGVVTGSYFAEVLKEKYEDPNISYYTSYADLLLGLDKGYIDCFIGEQAIVNYMCMNTGNHSFVPDAVYVSDIGFAFPKNEKGAALRDDFNEFLAELEESGELERLRVEQTEGDVSDAPLPDIENLSDENGRLSYATELANPPFIYLKENSFAGFEAVLITKYCEERGLGLDPTNMDFNALIPAIASGKYDLTSACISITEERAESVNFSDPICISPGYAIIPYDGAATGGAASEGTSFISGVADSFYRTFIEEDRWYLFLRGFLTTIHISMISLICGTVLGYLLFRFCARGGRIRNAIVGFCMWLIRGLPVVIFLMVLFYIVFAALDISGKTVSVIAFTLIFAVAVVGMLRTGDKAFGKGQYEGAYALGYSKSATFNIIMLPQIVRLILPTYKAEVITLLKATAVVGYIAVQDITKVGDIIRSATYEAFFPIVSVAVIYLIVEVILQAVIDSIGLSLKRKRKREISSLKKMNFAALKAAAGLESGAGYSEKGVNAAGTIEIEHVKKSFADGTPLTDVNTVVNKGDVVAIIGPSGCGKSTLLRCINLLDPPTAGKITVNGKDITASGMDASQAGRMIGMVFQSYNLFGHWTVIENIIYPQMQVAGRKKGEAYMHAMQLLEKVGLKSKAFSYPDELSGGQKQRIEIVRALAMDPGIVLLDEPTSALDPGMVRDVERVIKQYVADGRTVMMVTHEMRLARSISNRVFYMDEGVIYEEGTPEQIFDAPKREKTRAFVNNLKTMAIVIDSEVIDFNECFEKLDEYCMNNEVPRILARRARAVFEEICVVTILPQMKAEEPLIEFRLNWDANKESLDAVIRYNGEHFDPKDVMDDLTMTIAIHQTSSYVYSVTDTAPFTNRVDISIIDA